MPQSSKHVDPTVPLSDARSERSAGGTRLVALDYVWSGDARHSRV
jgi:hypothetical protein